jgi:hypothetical protein
MSRAPSARLGDRQRLGRETDERHHSRGDGDRQPTRITLFLFATGIENSYPTIPDDSVRRYLRHELKTKTELRSELTDIVSNDAASPRGPTTRTRIRRPGTGELE